MVTLQCSKLPPLLEVISKSNQVISSFNENIFSSVVILPVAYTTPHTKTKPWVVNCLEHFCRLTLNVDVIAELQRASKTNEFALNFSASMLPVDIASPTDRLPRVQLVVMDR